MFAKLSDVFAFLKELLFPTEVVSRGSRPDRNSAPSIEYRSNHPVYTQVEIRPRRPKTASSPPHWSVPERRTDGDRGHLVEGSELRPAANGHLDGETPEVDTPINTHVASYRKAPLQRAGAVRVLGERRGERDSRLR
jgi:hypothetical protein